MQIKKISMSKRSLIRVRILICGGRNWTDKQMIHDVLVQHLPVTSVIRGCANGADTLGGEVAEELGICVMKFPAN